MGNISSCENPKRIINPYTDEVMYVPCRECSSCLNMRTLGWSKRLERESTLHRYAAFITLTYDNENLPYFQPSYYDEENMCVWNSNRLDVDDELVGDYAFHPVTHSLDLDYNCIPHLCKQDVVKFIKRLRSSIHYHFKVNNIFENERIRYFLCGEYGPKSLRPHYHAIVWFDSEALSKVFETLLSKSWTLGFIDFQFVNSNAPQYVAKYVAGLADLPEVLQSKPARLFHLQSKNPVIGYTEADCQRYEEEVVNGNYGHVEYDVKRQTSLFVEPPLSLEYRYFPKCREYRFNSRSEKLRIYSYAYDISEKYGFIGKDLTEQVHSVFESAVDIHCTYACRRFCLKYSSTPERYLDILEHYYYLKEQYRLRKMYEYQQDYVDVYRMPLYHLMDFDLTLFERVPHYYYEFKRTKLKYIFNSYGIDDEFISKRLYKFNGYYGRESHVLDCKLLNSLHQNTSSFYIHNLDVHRKIHDDSIKVKVKNELFNKFNVI